MTDIIIPPDIDANDEEFVNEDCPNECSYDHPVWHDGETFVCPETGEDVRHFYCYSCGWERTDRWESDRRVGQDGHTYCSTCYWDIYESCDGCGEEEYRDEMVYSERRDAYLCHYCAEEDQPYSEPGEHVHVAGCCGTANVHLDLLTETFLCTCKAVAARQAKRPVLMQVA